ncbi:hypothetical protein A6J64_021055 [Yersinia enterocolitica]|nr:hypothetical protein A6J64_021055 [Yersinia enterocolitica]
MIRKPCEPEIESCQHIYPYQEKYSRHTSSSRCVGCLRYSARPWASPLRGRCTQRSNLLSADLSPQSLTYVSSWGFTQSPPFCNSNYLGYNQKITQRN